MPWWARTGLWLLCWALAGLGAFGAASTNQQMMDNWVLAAGVPALALCVIGLEACTAAGWAPGPFRPALAWFVLALNVATTGTAAWINSGDPVAFFVAAVMPLAFSPALAYAHGLWRLRCEGVL
ncbi:hypothetical protein CQJ94_08580 [Glycomyces fuscus]|nr:hypothetical protein CQJ94_08580 [Glycomyces fuscus]